MRPGGGDQAPHLAEHYLRLATALMRHGLLLQPLSHNVLPLVEGAIAAAAACIVACHKKVATCGLTLLSAVVAAAAAGGGNGTAMQGALVGVIVERGVGIVAALLGCLLAPSPLPRVHKISALLLDVASLLQLQVPKLQLQPLQPGVVGMLQQGMQMLQLEQQVQLVGGVGIGGGGGASCGGSYSYQQQQEKGDWVPGSWLMPYWLAAAVGGLIASGQLPLDEGRQLVVEWGQLLSGGGGGGNGVGNGVGGSKGANRSYVLARKLKKWVREFAERHSRPIADGG